MSVLKELIEGGGYTFPFLLHIYDDTIDLYMINDNTDIVYNGITYTAASFTYTPADDGGASFETSLCNNPFLHNMIERDRTLNVELIAAYNKGEVIALGTYKHKYGVATWDENTLSIKLSADDRGNMTFPALIYNNYNNRGN
jgi:hypothetical protein